MSISYWAQVPFFLALLTPGWLAPPGVQKLFPSEVYSTASTEQLRALYCTGVVTSVTRGNIWACLETEVGTVAV